ncbi:MAG: efflux RND transporter periplasmic adaptor subunit [Daejeonella sp.]|uniref:efflux RND transporter periplasmic adaptor subunit n=1 Tax=Daejeonella sp. TaxID=2805397 RepID=UPI003C70788E
MKFSSNTVYLFAAFLLLISACGSSNEEIVQTETSTETIVKLTEPQFKNAGIKTGSIEPKSISTVLKLNGQIDVPPQNMISISIPLGGYLKSTKMLPGTRINKGDVLAVMEDPQYIELQQDYLVTLSRMSYAEQEQKRQKELNSAKAGSDKALQMADSEFKTLRISAAALTEKLRLIGIDPRRLNERTITRQIVIRSPITGFISKVNGNIGSYVNPSDVLFELINPKDIHLSLTVFEKDLNKLAIGQSAVAFSNNDPQRKYNTKIILINRDLSPDRSVEVHCHFEEYDKTLVPGMYMNAEIALNDKQQATLPENSVVSFESKQYVFVEKDKFTYEMTEVEVGEMENGFISVMTNLGKRKIVTDGAYALLMQLKNVAEE